MEINELRTKLEYAEKRKKFALDYAINLEKLLGESVEREIALTQKIRELSAQLRKQ